MAPFLERQFQMTRGCGLSVKFSLDQWLVAMAGFLDGLPQLKN